MISINMKSNIFLSNLKELLQIFPIQKVLYQKHSVILVINPDLVVDFLFFLKYHTLYQFKVLTSVSGVDYPLKKHRFVVVYELLSIRFNSRFRVKTFVNELHLVPSVSNVFSGAAWFECEIWDMFGIFFENHPNLKRLLTDYGFNGHPLRKDFPLTGYLEVRYDELEKRVISESVELTQEFRTFEYNMPWKSIHN